MSKAEVNQGIPVDPCRSTDNLQGVHRRFTGTPQKIRGFLTNYQISKGLSELERTFRFPQATKGLTEFYSLKHSQDYKGLRIAN